MTVLKEKSRIETLREQTASAVLDAKTSLNGLDRHPHCRGLEKVLANIDNIRVADFSGSMINLHLHCDLDQSEVNSAVREVCGRIVMSTKYSERPPDETAEQLEKKGDLALAIDAWAKKERAEWNGLKVRRMG